MKERPILFSTEMVIAHLKKRKTMTRRMKGLDEVNENPNEWKFEGLEVNSKGRLEYSFQKSTGVYHIGFCPYGKPGDILWVRETWSEDIYEKSYSLKAHGHTLPEGAKWRPSIHMKKEFALIWLEITDIRVERLHEITDNDCVREGIDVCLMDDPFRPIMGVFYYKDYILNGFQPNPRVSFYTLWHCINGKKSWDLNPWVWVVSYKIISTTGKPKHL